MSTQNLNIGRGYQAQVTTSDGNLFTIGASWAGGEGGKNGELYDTGANTWTALGGCPVAPMLTGDAQGTDTLDLSASMIVGVDVLMLKLDI